MLRDGIRMDGRKVTDIRPIWSRAGVLPRTHGSALFTRGETQVGGWSGVMLAPSHLSVVSCSHADQFMNGVDKCAGMNFAWAYTGSCVGLQGSGERLSVGCLSQALCVATLGGESDAQRVDSIRSDVTTPDSSTDEDSSNGSSLSHERFYLQYFFPPSSVGECGRVGPAGDPTHHFFTCACCTTSTQYTVLLRGRSHKPQICHLVAVL